MNGAWKGGEASVLGPGRDLFFRLKAPGSMAQSSAVPHVLTPPRKLGQHSARLAARGRRERHPGRWWFLALLVTAGLALGLGGPGQKWYYQIRHYRWLQAAHQALERGDLATTIWTARRVLERDIVSVRAVELLAEAAARQNSRDAVYWRSRMVELEPDNAGHLLAWAKTAAQFNDLPTAVIALGRIPEANRQSVAYAEVAAAIAEAQGDAEMEARHLEAALALNPADSGIRLRLATAEVRTKSEATRSEGRATLDRFKTDRLWRRPALVALTREALTSGRWREALENTRELMAWNHLGAEEQLLRAESLQAGDPARFPDHLAAMQLLAARGLRGPGELKPVQVVEWMGRHQLGEAARDWVATLPPEAGKSRPVAVAVAQIYADDANWLGLLGWTKDNSWAEDEPLRMAYQALARLRGPAELRVPGGFESIWNQALRLAAGDSARLERLALWTVEWYLPTVAEPTWWALAATAADPEPALNQLAEIYRQRGDAHGQLRVAKQRLGFHIYDREAAAECAYFSLLLEVAEPDPHALADRLRRHPPLSNRGILACALSLWRREDLRGAVAIFDSIPVAAHEDPAVAWFYGTVLAAHGELAKASRYLALGMAARRCPEEELLFREARQRVQGQGRSR